MLDQLAEGVLSWHESSSPGASEVCRSLAYNSSFKMAEYINVLGLMVTRWKNNAGVNRLQFSGGLVNSPEILRLILHMRRYHGELFATSECEDRMSRVTPRLGQRYSGKEHTGMM
jgi:hypothetical protein